MHEVETAIVVQLLLVGCAVSIVLGLVTGGCSLSAALADTWE